MIEKYEGLIRKIDNYLMLNFKQLKKIDGLKFSNICKCYNGATFKSSDYVTKSPYKLITIKNIDASGFNTESLTYIPSMMKYEKYRLEIGDILLTMTGAYLGRSGIVDEENCYLNQRVLKIECNSKAFLYCFLKIHQNDIFALGKGSAQQNLSLTDLNYFRVDYSLDDIIRFQKNDSYIQFILNYKIKIKWLKNLKQKYLKKFFG